MSKPDRPPARVLLIVCGGIAAYKSLELIRRLKDRGDEVQAVMTASAERFVTPLSVAALSGVPVRSELFSLTDEARMGHIELSRAADALVVAPASANMLAKMAAGIADDLATTLLLATDKPVLVAPAMNVRMWTHPATARNLARLREDAIAIVGPNDGAMACGEFGPGRMSEPPEIVAALDAMLARSTPRDLEGRHVLVTAGPTHEPLDPVRYIGNRSSGKQGFAIAAAAYAAGARVTLISGPVALMKPAGVHLVEVETAEEMLAAVLASLPADVFVGAAAVADWRAKTQGAAKLKKRSGEAPRLDLVENPDILATVARGANRPKLVVGFAAETDDLIANARGKLARKSCDLIVANAVAAGSGVFGGEQNEVHIVTSGGTESWPRMRKDEVAARLMQLVASQLGAKA